MILLFDYFETIIQSQTMDFNRGLKVLWERYFKDKVTFEEIKAYGEELFHHLMEMHKQEKEFSFVKEELPLYTERYGGEPIDMMPDEEAEFVMLCNQMIKMPDIEEALIEFQKMGIPMYVLSNSGFRAEALSNILEQLGIRKYFKQIWSSADFGKIKPNREFFEMAIQNVLADNKSQGRDDIIYVGDTYSSDVVGANQAGIDVIWLNTKEEENVQNVPCHEIHSVKELVSMVGEIRQ